MLIEMTARNRQRFQKIMPSNDCTVNLACGKTYTGDKLRINKLLELHKKKCDICYCSKTKERQIGIAPEYGSTRSNPTVVVVGQAVAQN